MLPTELLDSLQGIAGFERMPFEQVHQTAAPPVSIRFNPGKPMTQSSFPFVVENQVPWTNQGFYLAERPLFTLDPLLHAGAYYVQEASSMFIGQALNAIEALEKPLTCLDLCAAPGGKSTHLQSLLHPDSVLVCNEVIQLRNAILVENMTKWGAGNVLVTQNDPVDFGKIPNLFDLMVVDAPCSGSGLFRRDATAMNEWSLEAVEQCSRRQQRILADVLPALKPGGYLIYATCSFSPAEDEQILDWLHRDFGLQGIPLPWQHQQDGVVAATSTVYNLPCYRFFPNKVKGEGFFMALLQKPAGDAERSFTFKKQPIPDKLPGPLVSWVKNAVSMAGFQHKEDWYLMSQTVYLFFMQTKNNLRIRKAGIKLAEAVQKQFLPQHALALSTVINTTAFEEIALEIEDALRFLRRMPLELNTAPKGWLLVTYLHMPLGWIKNMGNRNNNYYPKEWRIRMQ